MIKYFATFDSDGNRTATYLADGLPYFDADIQEQFPTAVEISEADQLLYLTNEYKRHAETGRPVRIAPPVSALAKARQKKLAQLSVSAADAYVSGFTSAASGTAMLYDSDKETQTLLANIFQRTKEADWETKVRYPGIAPAGKAPVRARPLAGGDKVVNLLDAAQLKTLLDDLDATFFVIKGKLWGLQATVADAGTVSEVEAVVW